MTDDYTALSYVGLICLFTLQKNTECMTIRNRTVHF